MNGTATLVFIERMHGQPTEDSLALLGVARSLGERVAAVVCGAAAEDAVAILARFGADEVWWCDAPGMDEALGAPQVDAVAALVRERGFETVLFEYSILAGDVAGGLAARLDTGVDWDLQGLQWRDGQVVGTRLALGDSVAVDVGWTGTPRLAVFRSGILDVIEHPVSADVHRFEPVIPGSSLRAVVLGRSEAPVTGARLATAEVIVAGGRGVRDEQSLAILDDLADALGGVVAVSMPLVDRGWRPPTQQVGQTGNKVRPKLYVACGISGALGHRAGMEKSGTIVAINTDPAAPIFGFCDVGVVGDLHDVVPRLTDLVRGATVSDRGV